MHDFDSLWDYSNPAETEKKFRDVLSQKENPEGKDYILQLKTQIARTLGLQRKFDEAHLLLNEIESSVEDFPVAKIRYLLERGRTYNSSNVFDKAKECFLESYELALKHYEDNFAVDAAHMMGIVEKADESLKWNEIAMSIAEKSSDEKAKSWLGSLYNNTGWTYHDMGEYEKAMNLFEKNVDWHTERKSKMQLIIAKWCVARTLRSLGKVEEALNCQLALQKEFAEKKMEQDGYNFEEIGECLLLLNRADESKPYFTKAFGILSKDIWHQANENERLERLMNLSR